MKKKIHPEYFEDATITCACGAVYKIGSTLKDIQIELCAACHPFFTGKQKILDTARRVEKFKAREAKKTDKVVSGKKIKHAKRAARKQKAEAEKGAPAEK